MSLQNFISDVKSRGLARSAHFDFSLTLPPSLIRKYDLNTISLKAYAANTPSYNFLTEDEFLEINEKRKYVYSYDKGDLTVSFYVDADSQTISMFNDWKNLFFNKQTRAVRYYDQYVASGKLNILTPNGKPIAEYSFKELYPKTINEISLDWSQSNALANLTVIFQYRSFDFKSLIGGDEVTIVNESTDSRSSGIFSTDFSLTSAINRVTEQAGGLGFRATNSKFINDLSAQGVIFGNDAISKFSNLGFDDVNEYIATGTNIMGDLKGALRSVRDIAKNPLYAFDEIGDRFEGIAELLPVFGDLSETAGILGEAATEAFGTAIDIQNTINGIAPGTVDFSKNLEKLSKLQGVAEGIGGALDNFGLATGAIAGGKPGAAKEGIRRSVTGVAGAVSAIKGFKGLF